jgi:hypothetical protein
LLHLSVNALAVRADACVAVDQSTVSGAAACTLLSEV